MFLSITGLTDVYVCSEAVHVQLLFPISVFIAISDFIISHLYRYIYLLCLIVYLSAVMSYL